MAWTGGGVHGWEVQGVGMAEFTEMLVCVNLVPQLFSVAQTEAAFRHVNRLALVAASEVRPQPATRNPQPASLNLICASYFLEFVLSCRAQVRMGAVEVESCLRVLAGVGDKAALVHSVLEAQHQVAEWLCLFRGS